MAAVGEKNEPFGEAGSFKPERGNGEDVERRTSTTAHGRKMSRIGPPPRNSSIVPDDTGSGDEYSKLVEMEAGDAIKYRTCSWQKVSSTKHIDEPREALG